MNYRLWSTGQSVEHHPLQEKGFYGYPGLNIIAIHVNDLKVYKKNWQSLKFIDFSFTYDWDAVLNFKEGLHIKYKLEMTNFAIYSVFD